MWADDIKPLVVFAKDILSVVQYFTGKSEKVPDKKAGELQAISNLLQPAAKDVGSQLNISVSEGATVIVNLNVSSNDAAAAQRRIENRIAEDREPVSGRHYQKTFHWWQARKDIKAKTGDAGVISTIDPRPVKVIFHSEDVKKQMIADALFQKGFVVDVEVEMRSGRPISYKILAVHEQFDLPED